MLYTEQVGDPQPSVFKVDCTNSRLSSFDTYQITTLGNWIAKDLQIRASGAACDYSTLPDLLDRTKFRLQMEDEDLYNQTSVRIGKRTGPVRAIRGSLGGASAFGTTRYFKGYSTYWREDEHLRVHALPVPVRTYLDWRQEAANLPTNPVCPISNMDVWRRNDPLAFDYVDGGCASSFTASGFDDRQMNGPNISLAEVMLQDPQHPLPSTSITMFYQDEKTLNDSGHEEQIGAYGDIGISVDNLNSTEEGSCNEVKFASLSRIWQIKKSDSGRQRADTLDNNEKTYPFLVTSLYQPGSPPSTPCAPTLSVSDPGVGFRSDVSLSSPCGMAGLWFELYKAGSMGSFKLLTNLRKDTSFKDYFVERGGSFRYYAVSYNASGQSSSPSSTVTVTVTDTTAPGPPPIISGSQSESTITLSWDWTSEFDLQGYNVYRAAGSGGPYVKLTLGGPLRAINYTGDTGQLPESGVTYCFILKTADQAGLESTASNEVCFTSP